MALILWLAASPWLLWVFYAAIMRLKQVRAAGGLTPAMKVFGYPALFIGLLIDFVVNVAIGSLVFAEVPREWTLSGRLWRLSQGAVTIAPGQIVLVTWGAPGTVGSSGSVAPAGGVGTTTSFGALVAAPGGCGSYSKGGAGWRQRWALAIRVALLDAIDPAGVHRG